MSGAGGQSQLRPSWYPYDAVRTTLYSSYTNILLVFVPIGLAAGALGLAEVAVFFLNFLAIIPLAPLIAFSVRELSISGGPVLDGLLTEILSNATETIVGIIAVSRGQIYIAQSILVGSILFDSLLVLGCSFFFAGYGKESLQFNKTLTNILSSLMMVASISLIVPTAMFSAFLSDSPAAHTDSDILILSHVTAIILFVLFAMYLYFQLKTHACLFLDPSHDGSPTNGERDNTNGEGLGPTLGPWTAGCVLTIATFCVIICASYLTDTIDGLAKAVDVRKTLIALVLIPIAANAAKCATAVAASMNDRVDFAIRRIVGSVLQIALLVTPFLILLGWVLEQPMTLSFDTFEAVAFFMALLMVNYVIQDGRTNYFEGAMLIGTYIIIVVAFYVRPNSTDNPTGVVIMPGL